MKSWVTKTFMTFETARESADRPGTVKEALCKPDAWSSDFSELKNRHQRTGLHFYPMIVMSGDTSNFTRYVQVRLFQSKYLYSGESSMVSV